MIFLLLQQIKKQEINLKAVRDENIFIISYDEYFFSNYSACGMMNISLMTSSK